MGKEITCPSCNSTFEIDVTQTSGPKTKYTRKQIEDAVKAKGYVSVTGIGDYTSSRAGGGAWTGDGAASYEVPFGVRAFHPIQLLLSEVSGSGLQICW